MKEDDMVNKLTSALDNAKNLNDVANIYFENRHLLETPEYNNTSEADNLELLMLNDILKAIPPLRTIVLLLVHTFLNPTDNQQMNSKIQQICKLIDECMEIEENEKKAQA
jgi:hypothetical protein